MKHFLRKISMLVLLFLPLSLMAEDAKYLVLTENDGTVTCFAFEKSPQISYSTGQLIIQCDGSTITKSLTEIQKLTVSVTDESNITSIDTESATETATRPLISAGQVAFHHLKAFSQVTIVTLDGRMVGSVKADGQGSATIDLTTLATGVYVMKTHSGSYKIQVK